MPSIKVGWKNTRFLGMSQANDMQYLHTEYKTLFKEVKEDPGKWKGMPYHGLEDSILLS